MGVDIHSFIELSKDNGQTWKLDTVGPFEKDHYVTAENPLAGQIGCIGRLREIFWLLSGGYIGTATPFDLNGVERGFLVINGAEIQVPMPLRGLPLDVCPEIKEYWKWVAEHYNPYADDNFPSWMTLAELRLILKFYKKKTKGGLWGFLRVIRRMGKIEEKGWRARYTFWFSY